MDFLQVSSSGLSTNTGENKQGKIEMRKKRKKRKKEEEGGGGRLAKSGPATASSISDVKKDRLKLLGQSKFIITCIVS